MTKRKISKLILIILALRSSNLHNLNSFEDEKNYYYENISQDNYVVPIEFKNVDYTTYLSMGQEMKLCLNLFKEEDALIKEKEKLLKQKEELENMRENTEKNISFFFFA